MTQLIQTSGQVQTAFSGVASGATQVGNATQQAAPRIASAEKALKDLAGSAEATTRGVAQMVLSMRGGVGAFPQLALGAREATQGLKGVSAGLAELAPASRVAVLAIGGIAVGVAAVTAAVGAFGITIFRFAREMSMINETAKTLGTSFADLKNAIDIAEKFDVAAETVIRNFNGIAQAQANLSQNASPLRHRLLGMGVDPNFLNQLQQEQDPTRIQNMIRERGLMIQQQLQARGWTRMAARAQINQFAGEFGQDAGIYDRPAQKEMTREQRETYESVGRQSEKISEVWREIYHDIKMIGMEIANWGMPIVLTTLEVIKRVFDEINDVVKNIKSVFSTVESWIPDWLKNVFRGMANGPGGAGAGGGGAFGNALRGMMNGPAGAGAGGGVGAAPGGGGGAAANDNVGVATGPNAAGRAGIPGGGGIPGVGGQVPRALGGGGGGGGSTTDQPTAPSGAGEGGAGQELNGPQALAIARQHLGEDEIRDQGKLSAFFKEKGIKVNPAATPWCAAFVNATLAGAGVKGTGSLAAGSFTSYGKAVSPSDIQPGDIGVVKGTSPRTGVEGSHVGFLTGETRMGKGGLEAKMLGGNQGGTASGKGGVSEQWRSVAGLHLRRPDYGAGDAQPPAGGGAAGARVEGMQGGGAGFLAAQRQPLMDEVSQDPATKKLLSQMMATEGGGKATVEALFNRTAMIREKVPGYSIKDELKSGFYGPIKSGAAQATAISAAEQAQYDKTLAAVVGGGSNLIQGRTNQGMASDPGAGLPGRVSVPGSKEVYNFWEGQRRGVGFGTGASAAFAARQQEAIAAADRGVLDRGALSRPTEISSRGSLNVDVKAPAGTKVDYSGDNLLKATSMQRSVAMQETANGPSVAETARSYMGGRG